MHFSSIVNSCHLKFTAFALGLWLRLRKIGNVENVETNLMFAETNLIYFAAIPSTPTTIYLRNVMLQNASVLFYVSQAQSSFCNNR